MRLPLSALGLVIVLPVACGNSVAAFSPPDRLVVVSDDTYPPYLFRGEAGKLQGIIVDKWALWSKKTGIAVNVAGMPWIGAQEVTREGSADVIEAITYTPARTELYEFSSSYADVEARVFFHRSISGINNEVASMRGFAIGAKHGSACGTWLAEQGIDTIFGYPTSEDLIRAAGAGEVRLFCMDSPVARYYLFKLNLADEFRQTQPLYSAQFHWAVAKGRGELRDFIQRGFERISTAELKEIDTRWTGSPVSANIDPRYLYLAALAASIVAGAILLIAWHRTLAAQTYPDSAEQHALERIFYIVAVAVLVALGAGVANNLAFGGGRVHVVLPLTAVAVAALILAARRGYMRFARAALPPVAVAAAAATMITRDGVHDAAVFVLAGALVIGGVLLKRREMVLLTIATLAVLLGVGSAEMGGSLQNRLSEFTDARYVVGISVVFLFLAISSVVVAESLFTGLRQAEEKSAALSASEQRFGQMFRLSPDGVIVTSVPEGRVIEANEAMCRILGRPRGDVIGKTVTELEIWRDAFEHKAMVALPAMTPGGIRQYEHAVRTPQGEKRDLLARTTRIELQGEAVLLSIVRDITERRRAQLLLEESEERLAKMIEASPEAITIASVEDGTFILVNPAGERLSGYTREEMIGRSAVAMGFYPDLEERRRLIADLQRNEIVHGRELRLRRKDGKVRDVLASAALIDTGGQRVVLFQGIDITERKNAEMALREHQELLRELSAHHESVREGERAHIAREIHDEMGQALTALKMDLSVIGLESGKKAPRVTAQVRELKQRVDGLIQTVRNVATALRPAALDLGILPGVEWLVDEFQKRNGIPCNVRVENGEVDLPEDRGIVLFRILQESLTNIARHAEARSVEISLRRDDTHVRLDVKDDGKGFDTEAAGGKKTFGLLGMRERVIMLHGTLNITSVPGEGTQVSVSIPVRSV